MATASHKPSTDRTGGTINGCGRSVADRFVYYFYEDNYFYY
eukprot:COSAG01_NODE_8181_length_2887_cov_91.439383_6_plen_41_part_00